MNSQEIQYFKKLSEENAATQKAIAEIKAMFAKVLSERKSKKYIELGYRS